MKELYEKPDIELVSFLMADTITNDEGDIGNGDFDVSQGVEEW